MKILQNRTIWIITALIMLMALTRFNHFGSLSALPDASYAVFFLAGLYLGRVRNALAIVAFLLVEAVLIDYYVINFRDTSAWCVTSAYAFLLLAYVGLWFVARWYVPRHELTGKGLLKLLVVAVVSNSLAFVIANVSFYLLAGYFGNMSIAEYTSSVTQYYGSYVEVALLYIGCAVIVQMLYTLWAGKEQHVNKAV